jgi:hypothetical protein
MQYKNPRRILQSIFNDNGISILENPHKFRTVFFRLSNGEFKKECNGLLQSIEEKIPFEMYKCNNSIPYEIYAARYYNCLQEKYGLTQDLAIWTIESWAFTFGIMKDELIDVELELEEFKKSKALWERGELPWSWWSTVGMKRETEIARKIEDLKKNKGRR